MFSIQLNSVRTFFHVSNIAAVPMTCQSRPWLTRSWAGPMLHAIQEARISQDSKHIVDMPLRATTSIAQVEAAWAQLVQQQHQFGQVGQCSRQQEAEASGGSLPEEEAWVEALRAFVGTHFEEPGSDLQQAGQAPPSPSTPSTPGPRSSPPPSWLEGVGDRGLRELGLRVHGLWPLLHRQVSLSVTSCPDHHTLLPLPHPFVVPGDRFRECYYWDSYWVIQGLLASGLRATARHIVLNLLHLVDILGHVPNGARTYYTNRSQPPLLSAMVMAVAGVRGGEGSVGPGSGGEAPVGEAGSGIEAGGEAGDGAVDVELLRLALPHLITEWGYWTQGPKAVRVVATSGNDSSSPGGAHCLSRYYAAWEAPRPESYREDWEVAAGVGEDREGGCCGGAKDERTPTAAQRALWRDLATAAESGWDFSSRWMVEAEEGEEEGEGPQARAAGGGGSSSKECPPGLRGADGLRRTRTTQIVPVDLNAFLVGLARDIATAARLTGDGDTAVRFDEHAAAREAAVNELMWSEGDGCWHDLLLTSPPPPPLPPQQQQQQQQQCQHTTASSAPAHEANTGNTHNSNSSSGGSGVVHTARQLPTCTAANWVPLWRALCCRPGSARAGRACDGLAASGLVQAGGVMTTNMETGQQWDAPNAWPPLQHMLIEGLACSGHGQGRRLARRIAAAYLTGAKAGYDVTGHMHEKYNAMRAGVAGGGGEYAPQVGFGWSNGVVLALLQAGYGLSCEVEGVGVGEGEKGRAQE